ncbi:heat shock protein HslJ [Arthrobacter sp. UYEF3]
MVSPGSAPVVVCAAFTSTAPCRIYASVSGHDGSGDLPWMASGAITTKLESVDNALHLTIVTPCGPLSGSVTRDGLTLNPGPVGVGAAGRAGGGPSGCTGGQELWLLDFLKKPFEVVYGDGHLTWTNDKGTLVFKPS